MRIYFNMHKEFRVIPLNASPALDSNPQGGICSYRKCGVFPLQRSAGDARNRSMKALTVSVVSDGISKVACNPVPWCGCREGAWSWRSMRLSRKC